MLMSHAGRTNKQSKIELLSLWTGRLSFAIREEQDNSKLGSTQQWIKSKLTGCGRGQAKGAKEKMGTKETMGANGLDAARDSEKQWETMRNNEKQWEKVINEGKRCETTRNGEKWWETVRSDEKQWKTKGLDAVWNVSPIIIINNLPSLLFGDRMVQGPSYDDMMIIIWGYDDTDMVPGSYPHRKYMVCMIWYVKHKYF